MAAGVEIVELTGNVLHPFQIVSHERLGEAAVFFRRAAEVQRIGRVGDDGGKAVFPQQFRQGVRIGGVQRLGAAPPGIAGKKLECVRAQCQCLTSHGAKPLGRG